MLQRIQSVWAPGSRNAPTVVIPEVAAINDLANDFVWLSCLIKSLGHNLLDLKRYINKRYCKVHFDPVEHEVHVSHRRECDEDAMCFDMATDTEHAIKECVNILRRDVLELFEVHHRTDWRLVSLPQLVSRELRALKGVPWIPFVQRECMLELLRWPIRVPSHDDWGRGQLQDAKPWIPIYVDKLLEYAKEADPTEAWRETCSMLGGFRLDLIAVSSEFGHLDEDGPVDFKQWRHEGRVYDWLEGELSWRLAAALWQARPTGLHFDDLGPKVWDDHTVPPSIDQVGSQRTNANEFFARCEIPMHVEAPGSTRWATLKPGLPKKKPAQAKKPV